MILAQAIGIVIFQVLFICSKSSSTPKKNIKNIKPKLAISSNVGILLAGQIALVQAGIWPSKKTNLFKKIKSFYLKPRREGPKIIPAIIWPITCGCRINESNLAKTLHTTKVIKTCIKNVAKGLVCGSSKRTTIVVF